jgi:hypothetical protein
MKATLVTLTFADGFRTVRRNLPTGRIDSEAARIRPGVELVRWELAVEADLFDAREGAVEIQTSLF